MQPRVGGELPGDDHDPAAGAGVRRASASAAPAQQRHGRDRVVGVERAEPVDRPGRRVGGEVGPEQQVERRAEPGGHLLDRELHPELRAQRVRGSRRSPDRCRSGSCRGRTRRPAGRVGMGSWPRPRHPASIESRLPATMGGHVGGTGRSDQLMGRRDSESTVVRARRCGAAPAAAPVAARAGPGSGADRRARPSPRTPSTRRSPALPGDARRARHRRLPTVRCSAAGYRIGPVGPQDAALDRGRRGCPVYRWTTALSGFAVELTPGQAASLRRRRAVAAVEKNERPPAGRDRGPPGPPRPRTRGRGGAGVVVGVVDTGIWPDSPVFAARPRPRPGPRADFSGTCQPGEDWSPATATRKLVRRSWFVAGFGEEAFAAVEPLSARDDAATAPSSRRSPWATRGSPCSSPGQRLGPYGGVAPQARLAAYKACWTRPGPRRRRLRHRRPGHRDRPGDQRRRRRAQPRRGRPGRRRHRGARPARRRRGRHRRGGGRRQPRPPMPDIGACARADRVAVQAR